MSQIFVSTSKELFLDDLGDVKGFASADAGTPYSLVRTRAGLPFTPINATSAVAIDPEGGLQLNTSDQLRIKVDNTSGDSGVSLSTDGLSVVDRVKKSGDNMTGALIMEDWIIMNGLNIKAVKDPIEAQDAATKSYVDSGGVGVHTFDHTEIDFKGSLGLPSLPINHDWDIAPGIFVDQVFDPILNQDVTKINDDAGSVVTITHNLTAQDWQDLFDYGGTMIWRGRCDGIDGMNGGGFWLQCNLNDSPVSGEISNRRYLILFYPDLLTNNLVIKTTIEYNTGIPAYDRYTTIELQIPPGLGTAAVYVNGSLVPLPCPYSTTSFLQTYAILSSGSSSGTDRVTYAAHFGVIIYKEPAVKLIIPSPTVGLRFVIPWGPRAYRIEASETITTLPEGTIVEIWAHNIGGDITFTQENAANPRLTYGDRVEKKYSITDSILLKMIQTSTTTPRMEFVHNMGSYFRPIESSITGRSCYVSSSITAEHTGVLNVGATEWSMGSSGTGPAMANTGYVVQTPTRIISGSLSVASTTTGGTVPAVSVTILLNGTPTVYYISKDAGVYSGIITFISPIDVFPGHRIAFVTRTNDTASIVTGHVTLQMLSLV